MRRALIGLAVATLAALSLTAPAAAAPGQVTHFRISGGYADAWWNAKSETLFVDTSVVVFPEEQGPHLRYSRFIENFGEDGEFTGGTSTEIDTFDGFTFTIDTTKLSSARLTGSDLPATTCEVDGNFKLIEDTCVTAPMDVDVAWTGQGSIGRGVANQHYKADGFSFREHFSGSDRFATVDASFGDLTMSADDFVGGSLQSVKQGVVMLCIGNNC